jgi:hypothetical protein
VLTAAIADWERSHAAVRACGVNAPAPWERIRYFTGWAPSAIARGVGIALARATRGCTSRCRPSERVRVSKSDVRSLEQRLGQQRRKLADGRRLLSQYLVG